MKRKLLIIALLFVSLSSNAQVRRIVLLEHFTQASCGPCASANPIFEANISDQNTGNYCHLAYHTDWPGVDPLNPPSAAEVQDRVSLYAVSAVPELELLGNQWNGNPGNLTQAIFDNAANNLSPLKIVVSDNVVGTNHNVLVSVKTKGSMPAGIWNLFVAVVEDPVSFATPPGSNGETNFPNVFRKFLNTSSGTAFTAAPIGSNSDFTYTFTSDPTWINANVQVIAWIQNATTKEVIQAGSTKSVNWQEINVSPTSVAAGSVGVDNIFDVELTNFGSDAERFKFTLEEFLPSDWSAVWEYDGILHDGEHEMTIWPNQTRLAKVHILPCNSAGIGTVSLVMSSLDNPNNKSQRVTYSVISNVKELLVNNSAGRGDGTGGSADDWETNYVNAINSSGVTCMAKTNSLTATKLAQANLLNDVDVIYYNVGWTFPSLNDDMVSALGTWLNTGNKGMIILGQDAIWDNFDLANGGNGTVNTQNFLTNYFGVGLSADGDATSTSITPITSDPDFGSLPTMPIIAYYGTTYYYPDELVVTAPTVAIANYNGTAKIAGAKRDNGTYRTMVWPIGLEMLSPADGATLLNSARNYLAYGTAPTTCTPSPTACTFSGIDDSQYNLTLGIEDNSTLNIDVVAYPNPCNQQIRVTPNINMDNTWSIIVTDITGKVIYTQSLLDNKAFDINTTQWTSGSYLYSFYNGVERSSYQKFEVIH